MHWRYKAAIQSGLSSIPAGERLHYLLQRWVTHSVTPSDEWLRRALGSANRHLELLRGCGQVVDGAAFYEFGAGWSLIGPLVFYALGVDAQVVVDVRPLARRELVADAIERLGRADVQAHVLRAPPPLPPGEPWTSFLRAAVRIDYRAPCDARRTGLPPESVDCVTSTATLEHVQPADIALILAECHRLLRPGGLMSHFIDYKDHYAQFDGRISVYNFLQYSGEAWRRYSPSLHFQNRLRHPDYLELIERAGFAIVDVEPRLASPEELEQLRALPLAEPFRHYDLHDLSIRGAWVAARKRAR